MSVKARLITIGDEILIGQIVDTNSAFISSLLEANGVKIDSIISISDSREAIENAIKESIDNFEITITTGGLGPTKDDITKDVLATIFNCPQELHEPSVAMVKMFLDRRNIPFNDLNRSQAVLPTAATVIPNKNGTAPGLMFEKEGNLLFNLPGVPHEMKALMNNHILDIIRNRFSLGFITHKTAITFGIPESMLAERIESWESSLSEGVKLAYLPSPAGVRLRLTYRSDSNEGAEIVDKEFARLEQIIGDNIVGYGEKSSIEAVVADILQQKGATLSVAESCTGGRIASLFTAMEGASTYFNGGVVSYSNDVKANVLGVDRAILENQGAVSKECAEAMAKGVRERLASDYAISTTGIAGPAGGTDEKPVGLVWMAIATAEGVKSKCYNGGKLREINIARFAVQAVTFLHDVLLKKEAK